MRYLSYIFIFIFQTNIANAEIIKDSTIKRHSISLGNTKLNFIDGRGFIIIGEKYIKNLSFFRIKIPNILNFNFEYDYNFKNSNLSIGMSCMEWSNVYLTPDEKRETDDFFQPTYRYLNQFGVFAKYKFKIINNLKLAPILGVNYRFGETRYYVHKFYRHSFDDGQFYRSLGPNMGFSAEYTMYKSIYLKANLLYQYYFEKYDACECYPVEYSKEFKREIPNRQYLQANLSLGVHFNAKLKK